MTSVPKERAPDSTLAIVRDAYHWIGRRADAHGSDIFEARLLGERTFFVRGADAAEMFYAPDKLTRDGAIPNPSLFVLQGRGSVEVLDGEAHRHRKQAMLALMTRERIAELVALADAEWEAAIDRWEGSGERVVIDDEAREVIGRAVCAWAGVPLAPVDARRRSRDLAALFDGAVGFGPRLARGIWSRVRTERWTIGLVRAVRAGRLHPPEGTALHAVATHRDLLGALLDDRTAAIELINVLRPTVAVSRYVSFALLALASHPHERAALRHAIAEGHVQAGMDGAEHRDGPHDLLWRFVMEVRRTAPFFPAMPARVREPFTWRGVEFPVGRRVMLDLAGTNRDPRLWEAPDEFRPQRFEDWDPAAGANVLVPQGGGDHATGHRCLGEWITIALMRGAVARLASLDAEWPAQDLRTPLWRLPSKPASGIVLRGVRRARHQAEPRPDA